MLRFGTLAVVLKMRPGAMALAARPNDMVQRRALSCERHVTCRG